MDSNYSELLKNPLWRNKRKRIIYRDGGKCTVCGSKKELHVHHTYYYYERIEPWRYPDESLLTVCESCHKGWHEYNENIIKEKPEVHKKKKRIKPSRKSKPKKKKGYLGHKKMSLAYIQANRGDFKKLSTGEWVLKNRKEETPYEKLKRLKKSNI